MQNRKQFNSSGRPGSNQRGFHSDIRVPIKEEQCSDTTILKNKYGERHAEDSNTNNCDVKLSSTSGTYTHTRETTKLDKEKSERHVEVSKTNNCDVKVSSKSGTDTQTLQPVKCVHMPSARASQRVKDLPEHMGKKAASDQRLTKSLMGTKADPFVQKKDTPVTGSRSVGIPDRHGSSADTGAEQNQARRYLDNWRNRKLKRVGKVVGTARLNTLTGTTSVALYVDSPENRRLNRVGKPRGSLPTSRGRRSEVTKSVPKLMKEISSDEDFDSGDIGQTYKHSFKLALCRINRQREVTDWERANKDGNSIMSLSTGIQFFKGELPDSEITGGQLRVRGKIGFGVLGKVFFATWMDAVVAVKKITKQSSRTRVDVYKAELNQFCNLEHPNVVQTVGFRFERDGLNILMEYMAMSLYEAIHLMDECIELSEQEKLQIIRQMSAGLKFLHTHSIAHGNLKSPNVLLNYVEGKTCVAKLTDYGLTTLKNDLETTQASSVTLKAQIWRYAAPEVLSGDILKTADLMKADMWSLSLLMHEVLYEEEPYFNLDFTKLKDEVGKNGLKPSVPDDNSFVTSDMKHLMDKGLMCRAHDRPSVDYIDSFVRKIDRIYVSI